MLKMISKNVIKYVFTVIVLCCIYIVLLTVTGLIPQEALEENVRRSSEEILDMSRSKYMGISYQREYLCFFNEALITNISYSVDNSSPFLSSMLARRNYIKERVVKEYPDASYDFIILSDENADISNHYDLMESAGSFTTDIAQEQYFYDMMHNDSPLESYEYSRYWHGYMVFLRPLLLFFDHSQIQIISAVVTFILCATFLFFIYRKFHLAYAITFAFGFLCINLHLATLCINEILVFDIAIFFSIYLLLRYEKIKDIGLLFLIAGSFTCFFDLLTAPIVTLGIPLTVYCLLSYKEEKKFTLRMVEYIKILLCWSFGYLGTWFIKWLVLCLFCNRNIFMQVIEQIQFRSSAILYGNEKFTELKVIQKQFNENFGMYRTCAVFILMCIYLIIEVNKNKTLTKNTIKNNAIQCIFFFFTMCLPFIWYSIVKEHSSFSFHFFTYRILIIFILNIQIIALKIFNNH